MVLKISIKFMMLSMAVWLTLGGIAHGGQHNDAQILEECRAMIQNLGNDAIKTLKGSSDNRQKREEQFRPLFVKNFDVEKIGKFVLAKYGRGTILPGEFEDFLVVFQRTIVSIYAKRLGNYDDEKLAIGDASFLVNNPDEKMVNVKSRVFSKDRSPINIAWTIVVKDDRKGIVDVSVENVSQAQTQRQEYADTLNNGGIKELIKKLNHKYEQNTGTSKQ
jgi:phospholipid transport system substrate-binding protein